jgi:hypothetical protein
MQRPIRRLCNRSEVGRGRRLNRMMDGAGRHYALDIRDGETHGEIGARSERRWARDGRGARGGSAGMRCECVS